jgi:hypothetical protein
VFAPPLRPPPRSAGARHRDGHRGKRTKTVTRRSLRMVLRSSTTGRERFVQSGVHLDAYFGTSSCEDFKLTKNAGLREQNSVRRTGAGGLGTHSSALTQPHWQPNSEAAPGPVPLAVKSTLQVVLLLTLSRSIRIFPESPASPSPTRGPSRPGPGVPPTVTPPHGPPIHWPRLTGILTDSESLTSQTRIRLGLLRPGPPGPEFCPISRIT